MRNSVWLDDQQTASPKVVKTELPMAAKPLSWEWNPGPSKQKSHVIYIQFWLDFPALVILKISVNLYIYIRFLMVAQPVT